MADYLIKELAKMAKLNQWISPLKNKQTFFKGTFSKIKGQGNKIKEQTRYIKQDNEETI